MRLGPCQPRSQRGEHCRKKRLNETLLHNKRTALLAPRSAPQCAPHRPCRLSPSSPCALVSPLPRDRCIEETSLRKDVIFTNRSPKTLTFLCLINATLAAFAQIAYKASERMPARGVHMNVVLVLNVLVVDLQKNNTQLLRQRGESSAPD